MKKEWRKIVDVHPAILYKDDFEELVLLLASADNNLTCSLTIQIGFSDQKIEVSSLNELDSAIDNKVTDDISISTNFWTKDREIISGISLRMYHNFINYQIHSYDEPWYLGKIEQLNRFFSKRKPWYNKIFWISYLFPFLIIIGAIWSFNFYIASKKLVFISATLFTISMVVLSLINSKSKLFPYLKVYFSNRPRKNISYQIITVIISILTLIATILGLIL